MKPLITLDLLVILTIRPDENFHVDTYAYMKEMGIRTTIMEDGSRMFISGELQNPDMIAIVPMQTIAHIEKMGLCAYLMERKDQNGNVLITSK